MFADLVCHTLDSLSLLSTGLLSPSRSTLAIRPLFILCVCERQSLSFEKIDPILQHYWVWLVMDPVSLTVAALSLFATATKVSLFALETRKGIISVNRNLEDLCSDVEAAKRIADQVSSGLKSSLDRSIEFPEDQQITATCVVLLGDIEFCNCKVEQMHSLLNEINEGSGKVFRYQRLLIRQGNLVTLRTSLNQRIQLLHTSFNIAHVWVHRSPYIL